MRTHTHTPLGMAPCRAFGMARRAGVAAALLGPVLLGGCMMNHGPAPLTTDTYVPVRAAERFPIEVTRNTAKFEVPINRGAAQLPAGTRMDVQQFLYHYTASAASRLTIVQHPSPRHGREATAIMSEIQQLVSAAGIPQGSVLYAHYPTGYAGRDAPILLSFESYVAIAPACGRWPENLASTYENVPHANFGCTDQHNLAAMVAEPRDLVRPRAMTPSHGGRRDVVMEAYRIGAATEADTSGVDNATVSEVSDD